MNNGYREYHFEGGKDMDDILKHIFGGSGAFHRGTANEFRLQQQCLAAKSRFPRFMVMLYAR